MSVLFVPTELLLMELVHVKSARQLTVPNATRMTFARNVLKDTLF